MNAEIHDSIKNCHPHLKTTFTPLSYQSQDFINHAILTFELYHTGKYNNLMYVYMVTSDEGKFKELIRYTILAPNDIENKV